MRIVSRVGRLAGPRDCRRDWIRDHTSLWEAKPGCEFFLRCSSRLRSRWVTTPSIKIRKPAGRVHPVRKPEARWNGPTIQFKYHAFPSGHTAASTAVLCRVVSRHEENRRAVVVDSYPDCDLARWSSVAHYFSDVTVRAVLGVICARCYVAHWLSIRNPKSQIRSVSWRRGGIRTHEGLRPAGFQDRAINHSTTPPRVSRGRRFVPLTGPMSNPRQTLDAAEGAGVRALVRHTRRKRRRGLIPGRRRSAELLSANKARSLVRRCPRQIGRKRLRIDMFA